MLNRVVTRCLVASLLLIFGGCSHSTTPSGSSATSSAAPGTSSTSPDNTNSASNSSPATPAQPPPAPAPAPIVIPAGTRLTVTLDQTISTKDNASGDRFDASLAAPVTVNGQELIPAGGKAVGTVITATPAGRLKGGAALALSLDSLRVNGAKYSIETSRFEEAGKGRGKRTAVGGGGGAVLGAIIGGIAGGGKGAAIGAVAGGGAGTAGAAYTGQRDIVLPAETRLHFKLRRSLQIPPQ
ncbi:MAG TPA: hypothetical protein VIY66_08780 [Candidatus Acidoferrales bacterium]